MQQQYHGMLARGRRLPAAGAVSGGPAAGRARGVLVATTTTTRPTTPRRALAPRAAAARDPPARNGSGSSTGSYNRTLVPLKYA